MGAGIWRSLPSSFPVTQNIKFRASFGGPLDISDAVSPQSRLWEHRTGIAPLLPPDHCLLVSKTRSLIKGTCLKNCPGSLEFMSPDWYCLVFSALATTGKGLCYRAEKCLVPNHWPHGVNKQRGGTLWAPDLEEELKQPSAVKKKEPVEDKVISVSGGPSFLWFLSQWLCFQTDTQT